ncbi:anthranilate synthase component I family protein [Natronomonas sp. EA1]|uniref:anthranilate synthase component I family protein n=1 Tax=Natronomonas sp. EA1 TaxID=3421655 RepID=UPI003EBB8256
MNVVTDRESFLEVASDVPAGARVPVEVRVAVTDPFDAHRRARDGSGIYLETTGGQSGWGYFAVDPETRVQVGSEAEGERPALSELRDALEGETLVRGDCDVPYPCGLFGWLSYDVARELEQLPSHAVDDRNLPHLQLGLFSTVAAWEEPRGDDGETTLRITACPRVDDPASAYDRGLADATALATAAVEGEYADETPPVSTDRAEFTSDCGRAAFAERVRRVKAYIRDGDTFQANISQRLRAPAAVHPVAAFAALREVNPAPYSGLLEFPGVDLVSASPELLLDVDSAPRSGADSASGDAPRADRLLTEPIAGTRPRGATPEADAALEAELTGDEKERAEHAMLVDLERNDLGKVARYGTVEVSEYRRVDRYSEVMHLVSLVEGRLREDRDLVDAVAAVFPGGTITGAPKPRTMEIIDELEATRRGPYTGSMAVFGFDGRATLNIVIRTLTRWREEYHLRVGAGIVHDSDPDAEYDETLAKGEALITAIDTALADATLTVDE